MVVSTASYTAGAAATHDSCITIVSFQPKSSPTSICPTNSKYNYYYPVDISTTVFSYLRA